MPVGAAASVASVAVGPVVGWAGGGGCGRGEVAGLVVDAEAPPGAGGVLGAGVGDLAGDVGDHGSPAGQVAGRVGQPEQRGQRHGQLDHPAARGGQGAGEAAVEQVEEGVGAQLVEAAAIAAGLGGLGDGGDAFGRGGGPIRRGRADAGQGGRALGVQVGIDVALGDRAFGAGGRGGRVGGDYQAGQPGPQPPGGQAGRGVDDGVDDLAGGGLVEVADAVAEHPGARHVDPSRQQGGVYRRQPLHRGHREGQLGVGGAAGPGQRHPDLLVGERAVRLGARHRRVIETGWAVRHRDHVGQQLRLLVGDLPGPRPQQDHQVEAVEPIPIDTRQHRAQRRTRRHLLQPLRIR